MSPVLAVVFDWAGTLTPWADVDVRHCWTETARVLDAARAEELGQALHEAERGLMRECRAELRSARIETVFERAGVECTAAALAAHFRCWEPYTLFDPAGVGLLKGLRDRGISTAVLSNTIWPSRHHQEIFARDGVLELFDAFAYTSDLPWVKPHPETFRTVLADLGGIPPEQAVYVGDRLYEDVHGAKVCGMRAVHLPHSNIPVEEHGPATDTPDATIQDLADLLAVVDRWNGVTG